MEFKTWLESTEAKRVLSVQEAKELSQSSGLDTAGLEFGIIEKALAHRLPVFYEETFPIVGLSTTSVADKSKILQMMGAFAQKMGEDAPDTLQQAQVLQIRGPDFRRMTPPIIVQKKNGQVMVLDGASRLNAAKLLNVRQLRALVIG